MKKNSAPITQAELQRAVQKFLQQGGNIERLPAQKTVARGKVGMKYNTSELAGESTS